MMSFDYLVGAIGGVFVLIYLIVALLRSEKF
jgi:K+-transporting ATPase KdpF subunit